VTVHVADDPESTVAGIHVRLVGTRTILAIREAFQIKVEHAKSRVIGFSIGVNPPSATLQSVSS
jgi:hypothetical protein